MYIYYFNLETGFLITLDKTIRDNNFIIYIYIDRVSNNGLQIKIKSWEKKKIKWPGRITQKNNDWLDFKQFKKLV